MRRRGLLVLGSIGTVLLLVFSPAYFGLALSLGAIVIPFALLGLWPRRMRPRWRVGFLVLSVLVLLATGIFLLIDAWPRREWSHVVLGVAMHLLAISLLGAWRYIQTQRTLSGDADGLVDDAVVWNEDCP